MLTRQGVGLLAGALVAVVGGWVLRWPESVMLGVALMALIVLALVNVARPASYSVRRRLVPDRVVAGDSASTEITISADRAVRGLDGEDRIEGRTVAFAAPRIGAGQCHRESYEIPTSRRGVISVGPLRLARVDPFRIASVVDRGAEESQLVVHPRTSVLHVPPPAMMRALDGVVDHSEPNGSLSFSTLREYVPGDDRRRIHWPSSARLGHLVVKELVDANLPAVAILLDCRGTAGSEEGFEECVSIAGSIMRFAVEQGFTGELALSDGDGYVWELGSSEASAGSLDFLAGVQRHKDGGLEFGIQRLLMAQPGRLAIAVLNSSQSGEVGQVAGLSRRYSGVVAIEISGRDTEFRLARGVSRLRVRDCAAFAELWNSGVASQAAELAS